MIATFLLSTLILAAPPATTASEPDGSRTLGAVPPFRAQPAPPEWLRTRSHELAALDCKHYAYEAYVDAKGGWLVRYVSFPDVDEAFRELEQVFLFTADPLKAPRELKPAEVQFEPKTATWSGRGFALVDRRDLIKP